MYSSGSSLAFYLCLSTTVADFIYPSYPPPRDLSSQDSHVARAWKNFTETFDAYLKPDQKTNSSNSKVLFGVENVTFSASLFSLYDDAATGLQYHHTAPYTVNSPNGTNKVDGDSIYKTASVSKLITTFAGQLKLSIEDWYRPLSEILPELAVSNQSDVVNNVQWDEVTPLALASHLAGIPPSGFPQEDILPQQTVPELARPDLGLPPLNLSIFGPCLISPDFPCPTEDFLASEGLQPSISESWSFPVYSNAAFFLLGLSISRITNQTIQDVYDEAIFNPLKMESSSASTPTGEAVNRSVTVPIEFELDGRYTVSSGGIFSTVNDLAKMGVGILNSTLLTPAQTRKWMKPITHTGSLTYSIGAAWEIIRYIHPSGKVTDMYGKLGDSGPYGGYLVVIPDYNAGFSALNAADPTFLRRSPVFTTILDQIAQNILPALDAQAAAEAKEKFAGTYLSSDPNLNSSLTIAFNESTVPYAPDTLSIASWISNGTDVLTAGADLFNTPKPRLLPNKINLKDGKGQISFLASGFNSSNSYLGSPFAAGPMSGLYTTGFDFAATGKSQWGGALVSQFVFDVGSDGKATAVTPSAARAKLEKKA